MKTLAIAILCSIMLIGCGGGSPVPDAKAEAPRPVIAVIGDSVTAGYMPHEGAALQLRQDLAYTTELKQIGHVVTAAVGGATSAAAVYQAEWLAPMPVDIAVIMLGINDADKGMSRAESLSNIRKIIATWPKARVVIASPPAWGNAIDGWLDAWSAELMVFANASGYTFANVHAASLKANWRCHSVDRHPCADGHRAMGKIITEALKGKP